jgi:hypothetical protein
MWKELEIISGPTIAEFIAHPNLMDNHRTLELWDSSVAGKRESILNIAFDLYSFKYIPAINVTAKGLFRSKRIPLVFFQEENLRIIKLQNNQKKIPSDVIQLQELCLQISASYQEVRLKSVSATLIVRDHLKSTSAEKSVTISTHKEFLDGLSD